jgi:hypothetical protein
MAKIELVQFGLNWYGKKGEIHPVKTWALARAICEHQGWDLAERIYAGVWFVNVPSDVWHALEERRSIDYYFTIMWDDRELKVHIGAEMP